REIIWAHRKRLALGLGLLLVNRASAFVLPASAGRFIEGLTEGDLDIVRFITVAVAIATVLQAITTYLLSRILSVAAQHAIMEMRKSVEQHIMRLPTSYFDSTKSGVLISR